MTTGSSFLLPPWLVTVIPDLQKARAGSAAPCETGRAIKVIFVM
jgi:hypothetical protein